MANGKINNVKNGIASNIESNKNFFSTFTKILEKLCIQVPSYFVLFTWISVLILSLFNICFSIPETYFSNKDNFFNAVFVKWGWAWTLLVNGSYMLITSFVYGCDLWKKSVLLAAVRLFVGTCFWYFWVNIVFCFVEDITGVCIDQFNNPNFNITSKLDCKLLKNGSLWQGFDISGHCFLLTYAILCINSEIQVQIHWYSIASIASKVLPIGSKSSSIFKKRYGSMYLLVNVLFFFNCVLMLIWMVMLVVTCLYFHTFYSKALGASCGIASWMVTYNEWYKYDFSPGLPGFGPFRKFLQTNVVKYE